MNPYTQVGSRQVLLSDIRCDTQSRARFLAPLYKSGSPALCFCTDHPIEMGIACRKESVPVYYLYPLHRGDPLLHHPRCPHRVEAEQATSVNQPIEPQTIHLEPTDTEISSRVIHVPLLEPRPLQQPKTPALTGLPALLEAVVCSSGLNVWHPSFVNHRSYYQVRFRLIEAAKRIRPFGASTLADLLYFPPVFDPSKKDDIEFEWKCFLEQLQPTIDNTLPRGVIMGRVRSFEKRPNWTAPRIQLSDSILSFWLDTCPQLVTEEPNKDYSWLVLLAVEAVPNSDKVKLIDGASMRITPHWLPVFSPSHAQQANSLVEANVSFATSLHTDPATSWAVPDIILQPKNADPVRVHPKRSQPAYA